MCFRTRPFRMASMSLEPQTHSKRRMTRSIVLSPLQAGDTGAPAAIREGAAGFFVFLATQSRGILCACCRKERTNSLFYICIHRDFNLFPLGGGPASPPDHPLLQSGGSAPPHPRNRVQPGRGEENLTTPT